MQKVTAFLAAIVIMAILIVLQRFFLFQTDTGTAWSLMVKWFGLRDWFARKKQLVAARRSETANVPPSRTRLIRQRLS